MPAFNLPPGTHAQMMEEGRRLNRTGMATITNKAQAFQRDAWGQAVAAARGADAKMALLVAQGEEEAANLIRAGFAFVIGSLEVYIGQTVEEAARRAALEGSVAWQTWAGPIGWGVAALQLGAQIAAYMRGGLTPFFWSDIPFEAPGRVRAKLENTYGLSPGTSRRVVDATFPTLQVLFYAPLRECADYAQRSLERCRVGEVTPIKNIWRAATGGETCPEEGTSRGWSCFEREQLADHMALSALAIAGYENRQAQVLEEVSGIVAGAHSDVGEDKMATMHGNIRRGVFNLVNSGDQGLLRNLFGPGNRGGQMWRMGPEWYQPSPDILVYGAMVFGVGVSRSVMKATFTPRQVMERFPGITRLSDALLVGGSRVLSGGVYHCPIFRGRTSTGDWQLVGHVRGGPQFDWASLTAGEAQPLRQPRPRGVGFDPIGDPIRVPVQEGGISITPASRGLGYAMGTTGAGRRGGGLVGDQWRPQGVVASQAAAVAESPAVDFVGPGMGGPPPEYDPNVHGDELFTFPDEPVHTQLSDIGLLPLIAAAVFLS